MRGYILSVRPATAEAVIISDCGRTFRFHDAMPANELEAGDIVEFQARPGTNGGTVEIESVMVVDKWTSYLRGREPLVKALRETVLVE